MLRHTAHNIKPASYLLAIIASALIGCQDSETRNNLEIGREMAEHRQTLEEALIRIEKLEVILADLRTSSQRDQPGEHSKASKYKSADTELEEVLRQDSAASPLASTSRLKKLDEHLEETSRSLSQAIDLLSKRSQHNQKVLFRHIQALEERVGIPRSQSINSGSLVSEGEE